MKIVPAAQQYLDLFHCISPIFISIVRAIAISIDTVFLDGSKFEANSNKYKFVWKPTTFHFRLSQKALLLQLMHFGNGVPKEGIISSKLLTDKLTESQKIDLGLGLIEGGETALNKMRANSMNICLRQWSMRKKRQSAVLTEILTIKPITIRQQCV